MIKTAKKQFIVGKNTSYKAFWCIFLAGVMILFSLFLVSGTVTTTLNSPVNKTNNSLNTVTFNCSASSDASYIKNVSLFTNSTGSWVLNQTTITSSSIYNGTNTSSSQPSDSWNMTKTINVGGNYIINYTSKLWIDTASSPRNLGVKIQFNYANGTSLNSTSQNVTDETGLTMILKIWTPEFNIPVNSINVWMSDNAADSIGYEGFDNITYGTNQTTQTFPFNLTGNTLWNCLACDNNSECDFDANRTIGYNLFENSRTVPASASQGSTQTFTLNLTATDAVTSAYLNYNGTRYSTSITAGTYTIISSSIVIPSITADGTSTIFWELFTGYGGVNSTSSTMSVATSTIDNCSTNKIYIYNFTLRNEINQSIPTADITLKAFVQIYSVDRTTLITNYSTSQTQNYLGLCINSTFGASEKFVVDAEIEYNIENYQTEYYNIQNETLQNSYLYQNISLYDLNTTLAKVFKITYRDSGYRAVEDAIVKIYRKYIGETTANKITEIPITDYNGKTTASLEENDVIYSFYIYKYGTLLDSFEDVFVKCQYSSIDQCELNFDSFSSGITVENLENDADFNFTIGYNKTSRIISSTFNVPSGTSHLVSLVVTTSDVLETSVCTDSITSSSGTLSCTVPNTFGNTTIKAKLYKDGVFQSYGNIKLDQSPSDIYGGALVVLGLLVLFSLIGASISGNPVVMIISFLVGIIALVSLNLVSNNGFIGGTASILFLILAIIIILIKIGRRN